MNKYLYLTKKEWVSTWQNGGIIPLRLASTFLSESRNGTQTPDENRIHRSNVDLTGLGPFIKIGGDSIVSSLTVTGCTVNGIRQPDIIDATFSSEDGLVVCLSNRFDRAIAERLGKVACVEILDVAALKRCIDEQLATDGIMGPCEYTANHERDIFLKSTEDEWQDEFRLYWPVVLNNAEVILPAGCGKEILFDEPILPTQIDLPTTKPPAIEFTPQDLESIKALIIGYLKMANERPVCRVEICSVVLGKLRFNYDKTDRVLRRMAGSGLIRDIQCPIHSGHVELTDEGALWKPRVEIESPDPNEKLHFWTYPFTMNESSMCPFAGFVLPSE